MSRQVHESPFLSYANQKRKQEDEFDEKILKAVKKEMSADNDLITNASPIVASTVTLGAIQDLINNNSYILDPAFNPSLKLTTNEDYNVEIPEPEVETTSGPFEGRQKANPKLQGEFLNHHKMILDTQFDQVVDVQSVHAISDNLVTEEDELNLFSISDIGTMSNSDSSYLEIDPLNYDSGIEEEYDETKGKHGPGRRRNPPREKPIGTLYWDADETEEKTVGRFQCQYLWEFLQNLLSCKRFDKYIEWKNQSKGVFKLADHHSVARLWGIQKKRKNMTYDKLSRALRYYYSKNILQKVDGERLTYRFCKSVYEYKK